MHSRIIRDCVYYRLFADLFRQPFSCLVTNGYVLEYPASRMIGIWEVHKMEVTIDTRFCQILANVFDGDLMTNPLGATTESS